VVRNAGLTEITVIDRFRNARTGAAQTSVLLFIARGQ
jgi:hypothetical protein